MSRARKKPLPVSVAVVIIATIGSILVALINIAGNFLVRQTEIHFTQTAAARTDPISVLTHAPASVTLPNTQTQITDTSLAQKPESKMLFEDTFIDNRNNWYVASIYPNIAGGKYTHKVTCPADYGSYYCGTYLEIPFTPPKNFREEIDITILESSVNANIAVGFQLRRNNQDHYYILYFITDRFYQLSIVYNRSELKLIPNVSSDLIENGLGITNRFGVELEDTFITPIINGQEMLQVEDGNLPNTGKTYLILFISRGHSATLELDNFIVREVK